ncbi:MAG: ABC transporter permease [Planctomycetes bacterium]|nr:ABC transporter permease [Planctomycetota bacterium]
MHVIAALGQHTINLLDGTGRFWLFAGQSFYKAPSSLAGRRNLRLTGRQMFEIGTRSLPVMMVTGMFVGMVLAVQAVAQFKSAGLEGQLGAIVNMSVLRELGPVLAGILLAGRVGGAITAELGTMRVTEQLDALRAMGADPVRHLVAPRLVACLLLGPLLVIYADLMGIFGSYYVSVFIYDINAATFWSHAAAVVEFFDILMGLIKSVLFSGAIVLICCYTAFHCRSGAAGVGRACTESFVFSCIAILVLDFFGNVVLDVIYQSLYGVKIMVA